MQDCNHLTKLSNYITICVNQSNNDVQNVLVKTSRHSEYLLPSNNVFLLLPPNRKKQPVSQGLQFSVIKSKHTFSLNQNDAC